MEDFVTFELAKKLKERGFDKCCNAYYHIYEDETDSRNSFEFTGDMGHHFLNSNNQHRCAAPSISQALKWLREEKKLHIEIYTIGKRPIKWCHTIVELKHSGEAKGWTSGLNGTTYEETALAGIEYTLDNLI